MYMYTCGGQAGIRWPLYYRLAAIILHHIPSTLHVSIRIEYQNCYTFVLLTLLLSALGCTAILLALSLPALGCTIWIPAFGSRSKSTELSVHASTVVRERWKTTIAPPW